ncbi:MAG: alpha-amylase family glycosyl hydrolase [Meiothermus sp.]|nr:alpha-amylase family glycosyl hydrolase [Meiothermus sp.]
MKRIWLLIVVLLGFAAAQQRLEVTFTYDPPSTVEVRSVSVRGSFNDWAELPMSRSESGAWSVTVALAPGPIEYKFFINGQWPKNMCEDEQFGSPGVDEESTRCTDDGQGGQNAVRVIGAEGDQAQADGPQFGFEHDPAAPRFVSAVGGRLSLRFAVEPERIKSAQLQSSKTTLEFARQIATPENEMWRVSVPPDLGEYRIKVVSAEGQEAEFGPYTAPESPVKAVSWVGSRVGYQIFPDRFWNADPSNDARALETSQAVFDATWSGQKPYLSGWTDPPATYHCCQQYFGGDLAGVLEKLPHLEALGVSLIYFNPLFGSGSAHGYDTHDYMEVAPRLGDKATLRRLLAEARRRGIKVVFDFVPNHTGVGFWAFQDVVRRGRNSPYWNWYFVKQWPFRAGDGNAYIGWANLGSLPKLNTGNAGVQRYLIEVSKYWLRFGFDGIRVDVANEVSTEFTRRWRAEVKAVKPDAYLVGEVWDLRPQYLQGDQYDSLMNYTLGRGGSPPAFGGALGFARGGPLQNGRRAQTQLAQVYATYSEAVAAQGFNLIGSHDTPRVLSDLGGGNLGETPSPESLQRLRLASAILYALPGTPMFFQGEECGFNGQAGQWPVNELYRAPMQWERCNPEVLRHYQLLGKLRKENTALASSLFRTYLGEGPLLAFLRGEAGQGELLAAFNNGLEAASLRLPEGSWRDLADGKVYVGDVNIGAVSWRYLQRQ